MKKIECLKPSHNHALGGVTFKALSVAVLASLSFGGADVYAQTQEVERTDMLMSGTYSEELTLSNNSTVLVSNDIIVDGKKLVNNPKTQKGAFFKNLLKGLEINSSTASSFAKVPLKGDLTGAAAPTPTLDDMNTKASGFTPSRQYDLTTTQGTNTNFLMLDNGSGTLTRYWYTPSEGTTEKNNILNYLVGSNTLTTTGATADNYVFKNGTTYYIFDMTKPRPVSAYTLTEASSGSFLVNIDGTTYNVGVKEQGTGDQNLYFKWDNSGTNRKITNGTSSDKDFTVKVSAGTGDTNAYYKWTTDSSGNLKLTTGTSSDYDLIGKHDAISHTRINSGSGQDVEGDFFGLSGQLQGSAIRLYGGSLGNVVGDFVGNYASGSSSAYGGAIYNDFYATISSITGDFVGNYASSSSSVAYGGAIYNDFYDTISSITGDFVGNYVSGSSQAYGGAIYNYNSTISSITGDFVGNYASSSSSVVYGGAIYNDFYATISSITGDFVGNYVSGSSEAYGGAIYNYNNSTSTISSITGDFVGNYAYSSGSSRAYGGAIFNFSTISSIVGDFVGNYASSSSSYAAGGAICNSFTISSIVGDFVGNYAYSSGSSRALGGAIFNSFTISSIVGDFVGNSASSSGSSSAYGGAICNTGTISSIVGDFVGNYASSSSSVAYGGAIYNGSLSSSGNPSYSANAKITLAGNTFTGNYVQVGSTQTLNSIYNAGVINIANGATVTINDGWQTLSTNASQTGQLVMGTGSTLNMNIGNGTIQQDSLGKITNVGTINATVDIDTSDVDNPLSDTITVSSVTQEGKINLTGLNFIGGDIDDFKEHLLTVQILKNTNNSDALQLELAGALAPSGEVVLQAGEKVAHSDDMQVDTKWTDTYESYNLSTDIMGTIGLATTQTTNDSIGVTVTREVQNKTDITVMDTLKLVNQSDLATRNFNATVDGETYTATDDLGKAGAGTINVNGKPDGAENTGTIDLNNHSGFELDKATTLNLNGVVIQNAKAGSDIVKSTSTDAEIVLNDSKLDGTVTNAGTMTVENSEITGIVTNTGTLNIENGAKLGSTLMGAGGTTNINSDFTVENPIIGNDIVLNNAELSFATTGDISNANSFTINTGARVNLQDGMTKNTELGNVTLNDNLTLKIDGDFNGEVIDTITVKSITANDYNIVIGDVNILTPTTKENFSISPIGASQDEAVKADLANAIDYRAGDLAMTPIYKYQVDYDKDNAMLKFTRYGGGGGDDFNPAVLAEPVVAQAGVQATMNSTMNYAFQQADTFTKLPAIDRMARINANRYATATGNQGDSFSSTDFNENLNIAANQYQNNAGVWVRPYTSFESIGLDNGPTVNAITYGTLIGFDTDFKKLKKGWDSVFSGYVGYNGAHLNYNNVSSTLNGGVLGATETLYKGNFWTALTATVGASVADTDTMYGHENSTSLLAGIASKTGYNFEFKGGKIILQPIWMMGYSMINTFDYTNAAGVKIDSSPLHTIQLNPSIRLIGNLKNGWQPYASIGMVWNILNETNVTANGTTLPNMHIKPYVQYGVGLQKTVGERFTGFGQAMIHNGGRNGIALTFGFRWALGKDPKKLKTSEAKNITPIVKNAQFIK